jgi:hypothetical protein
LSQSSIDLSSNRKISSVQTKPAHDSEVSQCTKYGSTTAGTSAGGNNVYDYFKSSSIKKTSTEIDHLKVAESVRTNIASCLDAVAKNSILNGFATIDCT